MKEYFFIITFNTSDSLNGIRNEEITGKFESSEQTEELIYIDLRIKIRKKYGIEQYKPCVFYYIKPNQL